MVRIWDSKWSSFGKNFNAVNKWKKTPLWLIFHLKSFEEKNATSKILESTFPFGILSYSWGIWSKHLLKKKRHVDFWKLPVFFWIFDLKAMEEKVKISIWQLPEKLKYSPSDLSKYIFAQFIILYLTRKELEFHLWRGQSMEAKLPFSKSKWKGKKVFNFSNPIKVSFHLWILILVS